MSGYSLAITRCLARHKGRETGDEGVLAIAAEKHDFAITYFGTMITAADITELVTSDYGVLPVSEPTIIDASFGRANAGYTKEDCVLSPVTPTEARRLRVPYSSRFCLVMGMARRPSTI